MGISSKKRNNFVSRYGLGRSVYQISSKFRFSFGQGVWQTHINDQIKNTLRLRHASFDNSSDCGTFYSFFYTKAIKPAYLD